MIHPKIIAIEGADGVGKTSLCDILRSRITNTNIVAVIKTPFGSFSKLTSMIGFSDRAGRFSSFLLTDKAVDAQFRQFEWVIIDRYLLSTLVYHDDVVTLLGDHVIHLLNEIEIKKAEYTIYLEAEEKIIESRLKGRVNKSNHGLLTSDLIYRYEKYLSDSTFSLNNGRVLRMTSETASEQNLIVDVIMSIIEASES
jgi:thymidylate kinase